MSNRTDFDNVAQELIDYFFSEEEGAQLGDLQRRIATELHDAFVAGQEHPSPGVELEGPGVRELRDAFGAFHQKSHSVQRGVVEPITMMLRAIRVVLGEAPPEIVEGPGIPELRIAVTMLPPTLEYESTPGLRRLIEAAQVVIGERNIP